MRKNTMPNVPDYVHELVAKPNSYGIRRVLEPSRPGWRRGDSSAGTALSAALSSPSRFRASSSAFACCSSALSSAVRCTPVSDHASVSVSQFRAWRPCALAPEEAACWT